MDTLIQEHFTGFLCFMVFLSRLGDIGTTWLATPNLKMEANPIAKKLGWPYAFATLLTCLLPLYHTGIGVCVLTMSFMVSASNASKIWMMRFLGEEEIQMISVRCMTRSGLGLALLFNLMPGLFLLMLSFVIFILHNENTWGYYIGLGIFANSMAILVFYPIRLIRLHKNLQEIKTMT